MFGPIRKLRREIDELKMKNMILEQLITGLEHRMNCLVYAGGLQGGAVPSGGDSKDVEVMLGDDGGGDLVTDPNLIDAYIDEQHPATGGSTLVTDDVEPGSGYLSNVILYIPGDINCVVLDKDVLFAYEDVGDFAWHAAKMELVFADYNETPRALPVCVLR